MGRSVTGFPRPSPVVVHHEDVVPLDPSAQRPEISEEEAQAAVWIDDLYWHKKMYSQARFRWFPEDPINLVTAHTGGRLDFSTPGDVPLLEQAILAAGDEWELVRNTFASKLDDTRQIIVDVREIAALLNMGLVECESALWFHRQAPALGNNINIRRVLRFVPFRNPLLEAWELKQLLRLYEAAYDVLEDALCDLLEELLPTRDAVYLTSLTRSSTEQGMRARIAYSRELRGGPGDPRRVHHQVF